MYPVVCQIGPFTVYSYGLMMAVTIIVCGVLLRKKAAQEGFDPGMILDFVFWAVIGGLMGGRIFFIILNLDYFFENPSEILMLNKGGLAWQGGLILGTLTALVFIRNKKLPLLKTLDLVAPYIALGQSIGRLGCFLNGCCQGREVSWGIYFPVHQARLHPTQLYDALGLFIIFLILNRYYRHNKGSGEVFVLYLIGASLQRFVIEFFRADHADWMWNGLSVFQILALGVILVALYVKACLKSRRRI